MQTTNKTNSGSGGDIRHPGNEEWMALLYGEATGADAEQLAAHLKECGECRAQMKRWEGAKVALNFSTVAAPRLRVAKFVPLVKWGIAAAFVLAVGFAAGRMASPKQADYQALHASLKAELLTELKQEQSRQWADYQNAADVKQADDNKLIWTALEKVETDRMADYSSLHKEIETMAVLTQANFQQADRQIATLANISVSEGKALGQ